MAERPKLTIVPGGKGKLPPDSITIEELDARLFVELPTVFAQQKGNLRSCADEFNIELKDLHDSLDRNPALLALLNAANDKARLEAAAEYAAELDRQFAEYGLPAEPDEDLIGQICHLVKSGLNQEEIARVLAVPGAIFKAYRGRHKRLGENIQSSYKEYKRELNPGPYVPDSAGHDLKLVYECAAKGYTAAEIGPELGITPLQFSQALERDPLLRKTYQRGEAVIRRKAIDTLVEIMDDDAKVAIGAVKFFLQARAGWSDKPAKTAEKAGAWTPGETSQVVGRFVAPSGDEKNFSALLEAQRAKNSQAG